MGVYGREKFKKQKASAAYAYFSTRYIDNATVTWADYEVDRQFIILGGDS